MLGFGKLAKKVFGSPNDRVMKSTMPMVEKINAFEDDYQALSDEAIIAKTQEFKTRLNSGTTLDELLPEAFANCREAAKRTLGLRAFDVQLLSLIHI